MFEKREIEAYRSISAPDELREKVLHSAVKTGGATTRNIRRKLCAGAAAAGILLVAGVPAYMFGKNTQPEILFNGELLTAETITVSNNNSGVAAASARSAYTLTVPLEIDVKRDTDISVSGGIMSVSDHETGDFLYTCSEFSAENDVNIQWSVDSLVSPVTYFMTLDDNRNSYEIILSYNEAANGWTMSCQENK